MLLQISRNVLSLVVLHEHSAPLHWIYQDAVVHKWTSQIEQLNMRVSFYSSKLNTVRTLPVLLSSTLHHFVTKVRCVVSDSSKDSVQVTELWTRRFKCTFYVSPRTISSSLHANFVLVMYSRGRLVDSQNFSDGSDFKWWWWW
jgi:hypothetical protein